MAKDKTLPPHLNEHITVEALENAIGTLCRAEEYDQARTDGRIVVLPNGAKEQRILVEAALGLNLYEWQVAYIWGESDYIPQGRRAGKTMAWIIKTLLSKGQPLCFYREGFHGNLSDEIGLGEPYAKIIRDWTYEIYNKLKRQGGLELRKIYFSAQEADRAQRNMFRREYINKWYDPFNDTWSDRVRPTYDQLRPH